MRLHFTPKIKSLLFLFVLALGLCLLIAYKVFFIDNVLYIAVVGPMTGEYKSSGEEMIRGIRFCIDKINDEGVVDGKKIKLVLFDDKNDPYLARKRALEITEHPNILMVIGHYISETSVKGSDIYRVSGIPVITASATSDEVTEWNDWYFRVIFNNPSQGTFLAYYVKSILNQNVVSIIYDQDVYGASLARAFKESFSGLGGI